MTNDKAFSQLEARYKQPFARWSSATWELLVVKVLPNLSNQLKTQITDHETSLVIEAYLDLVAQGIGRGYFFPHPENEFPNFFIFAWERLLLPWISQSTNASEKIDTIAKLWNLALSLNQHPPWIESILISKLTEKSKLSDITIELKKIESLMFETSGLAITPKTDPKILKYKTVKFSNSPYFLPDSLKFEAPTLLTVAGMKFDNKQVPIETFFVLLKPSVSVFPQSNSDINPSRGNFEDYLPLVKSVSESIGLDISDFAVNHSLLAVVFNGSQRLHLWTLQ